MSNRKLWGSLVSAAFIAALATSTASAAIVFSDGFGDGDRDNNGLDSGAVVTDASDVGIPWYGVGGTSNITHVVVDDSAGIGSGNALRMFNTASNNRPHVGSFPAVTLADGDKIILSFDVRLAGLFNAAGAPVTAASRSFRFGLYNDNGTAVPSDQGSSSTLDFDDVGLMATVDVGPEAGDSTTMDVRRDDSAAASLIASTTTTTGMSPTATSTNTANQLLVTTTGSSHFQMILQRSGGSILISLEKDSNGAITGTDTTPVSFLFNEVMIGPRSSAAHDLLIDNMMVEYIAVPEPASLGLAAFGALALGLRRRTK